MVPPDELPNEQQRRQPDVRVRDLSAPAPQLRSDRERAAVLNYVMNRRTPAPAPTQR